MTQELFKTRLHRAVEEKLGGNWAELARRAGLTPSTLQQAKAGKDVRISTMRQIAAALGMPVDWFFEFEFEKKKGGGAFSREEELLVQKYRQLRPGDRTRAQEIINVLASAAVKSSKKAGS
ncbi:MAG: helix-turn-helix domain-containing protein [Gammaproteobacteria bacterium]|nr:helix-turn-helix domain-containing protein [Gammaproteobacteria bacterium]